MESPFAATEGPTVAGPTLAPMGKRELELRDRLLAPVAVRDNEGAVVGANLGALVRRLILFEQVVIDSYAMRELPALVDAMGSDSFIDLLDSGAVKIRADGWAYGETGNGGLLPSRGNEPLPPLQYAFSPIVPHDREHHISLCLGEIRAMPLGKRTSQKLRRSIVAALLHFPANAGQESMESLPRDLTRNLNLVYGATAAALSKKLEREIDDNSFEIRIEQIDDYVFEAITNVGERFGLDKTETDKVIESALLAICALNQRLEEIKAYQSIIGFNDSELPIVQEKFAFLLNEIDANVQEERFDRIIQLAGLPDPETAAGTVDVAKLLEARETEELREFRQWLRTLDRATDSELRERLDSVTARLQEAVHSRGGKTVRFVATTGIGFVPVIGQIAGPILGAADQFLLEKLLPAPGPVSFLGSTYSSIFKG
jgi:hypothetical protein